MKVEISHHIDSSDRDAEGMYEYYYEYDVFIFSDANVSFVARRYVNEPEAHFVSIEVDGKVRPLLQADLRTALFADAASHLRQIGIQEIRWLNVQTSAYEPVESIP